ncbi:RNase adapter RapZ [Streptomyces sp. col6]|uniref:RapZ C-terminal domain-containing protein n=1 Tax=Streptomyces sp. col6 TaxID=2478958 RepID=UPI0017471202|nr:RNase adapter RapZ [Streptomyces sp. col6]
MKTTILEGRGIVTAVIRSIGARHQGAYDLVTDGLYVDLRRALRNPADDPTMRYRTGLDADVYDHVLSTPGARDLINRTAIQLRLLVDEVPVGRVARLTVACQGGRHRSVAVAEAVGHRVWAAMGGEYEVEIEHHHIDHPVLSSSTPA